MSFDLDEIIERRHSDSRKWNCYGGDVIPLSGAEMEFAPPEPVILALYERVDHRMFGYNIEPPELREVIVNRLQRLYGWQVSEEALVFLPGAVTGFNLTCHAVTSPGDAVLVQTPVYSPILHAHANAGLTRDEMELTRQSDGRYTIDFDAFEATITARTRVFILCNPHNPVGRVFQRDELERMAEICLRHDIVICSDEIYSDWVFGGGRHLPIASLDPEIADRAITLIGTSKSHNIAGVKCGVAIVQNAELRKRLNAARMGLVPGVNVLEYTAALAAYRDGQPWQDAVLHYLEANHDFVFEYVNTHLPGVEMGKPEGTPAAWLDCRQAGIPGNPYEFFLQKARVALNDGGVYGRGGAGFVRLTFGCPRALLARGLDRMKKALSTMKQSQV